MARHGGNTRFLAAEAGVLAVLLLAWIGFTGGRLSVSDWSFWLIATAPLALAAMSQTIPVLSGAQGLTAGANILLVDVVVASAPMDGPAAALGWIIAGLALGGGIGALNGLLIGYARLPSTAVTFVTGASAGAIAYAISANADGMQQPDALRALLFDPALFGLPVVPIVLMATLLLAGESLRRARWGRALQTLGRHPLLAERRLPAARLRFGAHTLAGFGHAIAGILLAGQLGTLDSLLGTPVLLQIFAAMALAGSVPRLRGGSAAGALLGAAIVTATANLLLPLGIADFLSPMLDAGWLLLGLAACALAADRVRDRSLIAPAPSASRLALPLLLPAILLLPLLAWFRPQAADLATVGAGMALLALGQGAVMRAGGVDLSMPAVITAAAMALVALSDGNAMAALPVLAGVLAAAAALGWWHGLLADRIGRAAMTATLASAGLLQALAAALMVWWPMGFAPFDLAAFTNARWLGLAPAAWLLLPVAACLAVRLDRKPSGRTAAYVLSALCAAAFGLLMALFGGNFRLGLVDTYLLPTIAGIVLGGVAFGGGHGSLRLVVVAAILVQALDSGLLAFGLSFEARLVVFAGLILAASARRVVRS